MRCRRARGGEQGTGTGAGDAIGAFWSWWAGARPRVEAAIDSGDFGTLPEEFTERVRAIHPDLEWELGPGRSAEHLLCVTPAGRSDLRAITERWRIAGPAPDPRWEYAPARAASPETLQQKLTFEGTELALAECRLGITVDDDRQVLDIVVHHPRFEAMPDQGRTRVSLLVLDWLLGEDGVERWVGTVEASGQEPPASLAPDAVTEILAALQRRHAEPTWAVMHGTALGGGAALAVARRPLKRVEYPLFDLHGAIELPFTEQTAAGLPAPPALDRLHAFEDELLSVCGDALLLAAHETHAGTRTLHVYCDSQGVGRPAVDGFVARRAWPHAQVAWNLDPAWLAIRQYQ